jgi:short-subunit dehydrogenase
MNKKVLITGSTRGIGKSIGAVFYENGWDVCFTSRNKKDLDSLQEIFRDKNHLFEKVDFTHAEEILLLQNKIQQVWGKLDAIVINVGSGKGEKSLSSSHRNNVEVFDLNFYSAYLSSTLFTNLLTKSKQPSVIFIGSIAGKINVNSPINYAMDKRAIENLSNYLSQKLSKNNIRVNCIHPGHVLSEDGNWDQVKKNDLKKFNNLIQTKTLSKEIIKDEEVASFTFNLINSDFAQKLTGNIFTFDVGTSVIK